MSGAVEENAVAALEALYSGPTQGRELAQAREIFAYLRSNGQVSHVPVLCTLYIPWYTQEHENKSQACYVRTSCSLPCSSSSSSSSSALLTCRVR